MKPRKHSVAVRLEMVRNAVQVKDHPPVRDYLDKYGYGNTRWKEGEDLYEEASHYNFLQQTSRAEQFNATVHFRDAFRDARQVYRDNVKIARVALSETAPL